jgi:hypothetical protein
MKGYKTSKDYQRLEELIIEGYEVVCFTTYDFDWRSKDEPGHKPMMVTDICRAKFIKSDGDARYDMYIIGARGHTFINYWPNEKDANNYSFAAICEAENIEFIEPQTDLL